MDEIEAFIGWLGTYELPTREATALEDLSDGVPLLDVLSIIDPKHFKPSARASSSAQPPDNWVLRLASLKRLFRLISTYFIQVLNHPTSELYDIPDLEAIAKDHDLEQTVALCRLVLAIAVQDENKKDVVEHIQKLGEHDQHALMQPIAVVMKKYAAKPKVEGMSEDDHYYQLLSDRALALREKETIQHAHQALLAQHSTLQTQLDDALSEKESAQSRAKEAERKNDDRRAERADAAMRAEIERLRGDLQKSEDNLGSAESELEKASSKNGELQRKVEELTVQASLAAKLKDQVDEYKHSADRLQKMENVMEKYKKKLEESAELRKTVKTLEDQIGSLVDKNESLQEEYKKVSSFRPLMDSYKSSIADLETKLAARVKESETLKYTLEQTQTKLTITETERAADAEALELYQERVKELELGAGGDASTRIRGGNRTRTASQSTSNLPSPALDEDEGGAGDQSINLEGELDDATSGRTWTDMKLEIRSLKRELADLKTNSADASRVHVLETLLDDAKRSKARYEEDYLLVHREKLVLQAQMEEVRSGRGGGDGAEVAIALRQRLNEVVEELDALKKQHTELEVLHESQSRELTIAKSDLNLVNKDQLEILATLRESVNEDKSGLETEIKRYQSQIQELKEKGKMHVEQINTLLMEKVNLQSDGMNQREKMLERERTFADLRASIGGKDLPEDTKARLLALHEENLILKEKGRTDKEKLAKARMLLKEQDEMIKTNKLVAGGNFQEAEDVFRSQLKTLEDALAQQKRKEAEMRVTFAREQKLILSHLHHSAMETIRQHQSNHRKPNGGTLPASSWLNKARAKANGSLR